MSADKHERLVNDAVRLKRAWLCAIALYGRASNITDKDLSIPTYKHWENKSLKRHIADLEADFDTIAKVILLNWNRKDLTKIAAWFSSQFEAWQNSGAEMFDLGRVWEVENAIGKLGNRRVMDCPPYAQVLLQGFYGSAIRHPEYHLARDLALVYNLLLDAEGILDAASQKRITHTSEVTQSLSRSVILACFNLLESFVSGLAAAWIIENPSAPATTIKQLQDNRPPLHERLTKIPGIVSGKTGLIDGSLPPFSELLGELKDRRNSFVHCEPGPTPTKHGYVKEQHFHDANLRIARKTVILTCEAIRVIWKAIYQKKGPSWLPERNTDGRFPRIDVELKQSSKSPTGAHSTAGN